MLGKCQAEREIHAADGADQNAPRGPEVTVRLEFTALIIRPLREEVNEATIRMHDEDSTVSESGLFIGPCHESISPR